MLMLGYWRSSDDPDGPLPLNAYYAGQGAELVGDPRWWRAHWQIRLAPIAYDDDGNPIDGSGAGGDADT